MVECEISLAMRSVPDDFAPTIVDTGPTVEWRPLPESKCPSIHFTKADRGGTSIEELAELLRQAAWWALEVERITGIPPDLKREDMAVPISDIERLSRVLLPIIQQALGMKVNADHGTVIRLTADEINAGKAALEAAGKWPYRSWEKAANG